MRTTRSLIALAVLTVLAPVSGCAARRGFSIIFVDVEGGAATLIATPAGESILIDSGWPEERDVERIRRAARKMAGVSRIDHCLTTHWHRDHFGGIGPLSAKIPVDRFYDRGFDPPPDPGAPPELLADYRVASSGRSRVLRPGEELALRQAEGFPPVSLRCIVANGVPEGGAPAEATGGDRPSAGSSGEEGPAACGHPARAIPPSDNDRSLGFLVRFGEFEFLDLGDLTWNVEHLLVCPRNRIGQVDVYQVTHHGQDTSNNPALLWAVSPRVAVVNNGPRKGGKKEVHAALAAIPGIESIFQVHRNLDTADADNAPADQVANAGDTAGCRGEPISIAVSPDSRSYTVRVGLTGRRRSFECR